MVNERSQIFKTRCFIQTDSSAFFISSLDIATDTRFETFIKDSLPCRVSQVDRQSGLLWSDISSHDSGRKPISELLLEWCRRICCLLFGISHDEKVCRVGTTCTYIYRTKQTLQSSILNVLIYCGCYSVLSTFKALRLSFRIFCRWTIYVSFSFCRIKQLQII